MDLELLTVLPVGVRREEYWKDGRYTVTLSNPTDEPVELETVCAVFHFDFSDGDVFFLNGYQSWTYSPERSRRQFDKAM